MLWVGVKALGKVGDVILVRKDIKLIEVNKMRL